MSSQGLKLSRVENVDLRIPARKPRDSHLKVQCYIQNTSPLSCVTRRALQRKYGSSSLSPQLPLPQLTPQHMHNPVSPVSLPSSITGAPVPWMHDEEGGYASDLDITSSTPYHTAAVDVDCYAARAAQPVEMEEESTMDLRSQLIRSR